MKYIPYHILVLMCVLILLVSCGKAISKPSEVFQNFKVALSDRDFSAVWEMLSNKSKKNFETRFFDETKKEINNLPSEEKKNVNPVLGKTGEEILKMKTKDFFVLLMQETEAGDEMAQKAGAEVELVTVNGNSAKLRIKEHKDEVTMVKEGREWKVEL